MPARERKHAALWAHLVATYGTQKECAACKHDPRTCARHPYVRQGANGADRGNDVSPSKPLRAPLIDLAFPAKKR